MPALRFHLNHLCAKQNCTSFLKLLKCQSPVKFSSTQSLSHVRLFATPWAAACQASLSTTKTWSLLKLMSIESVMPSNHLILCHPLLRPSNFPSIRIFSYEPVLCITWPKDWNFSFNISPFNEYSGLISIWISLQSKGLSKGFANTTVQKHQFFGTLLSLQSKSHIHTGLRENHSLDQTDLYWQSNVSAFQYVVQVGHNFSSKE